jgi:hypothetical protein
MEPDSYSLWHSGRTGLVCSAALRQVKPMGSTTLHRSNHQMHEF